MRLYLDDDTASALLTQLLRLAGHDVQTPHDVGLTGSVDAAHLTHAIRQDRVLLSGNHDDFEALHDLLIQAGGHHPGIVIIRRDNNPRRDLTPRGMVTALGNLIDAGVPLRDNFHILNRITKMATSPDKLNPADDDMRPEYDFRSMRGVVRGKYAAKYRERLRVVRLAEDVATEFADEAAVNEALREYLRRRRSEHAPT